MDSATIDLDFDQISSLLSELSQPGPVPKLEGPLKAPRAFDSSDVSFETSDWLSRVLQVSIWLNLDGSYDASDTPETVALRLFDEFAPGQAEASFVVTDGVVQFTELGAQQLEERLSRALNHRATFLQLVVDEERSVAAATEAWMEAWSEPPAVEPLSINAMVDKWRIADLAGRAAQNQLDLNPTYQRDFVWSNADSQMLIESILRGIPLPSIILARASNSQSYQIVDGKQRLTATLRFTGSHPEGIENARTMKDFESFKTNFAQFARKNSLRASDIREKYLPFKTRKYADNDPLAKLGGRYYCDIRDEKISIAGEMITVADLFERTCEYFIPVLIYKDTQVRDIHRVFRLYNQQGMKLNAEEIRNAVFNHLLIARAMLYVSGDRPEADIAPPLVEAGVDPTDAREIINALGFGVSRFRRTKVLLWAVATLILKPAQAPDGAFRTPSTASHIDEFLRSIDEGRLAQFKSIPILVRLSADLVSALELHQATADAWHPKFRRKGKSEMASRWEELPVVASILACLVLVVMGQEELLLNGIEAIHERTAELVGPTSTQNKTQWAHIANASTVVLEALSIDLRAAHEAVKERYGDSAIEALVEIRKIPIG